MADRILLHPGYGDAVPIVGYRKDTAERGLSLARLMERLHTRRVKSRHTRISFAETSANRLCAVDSRKLFG